MKIVYVLCDDSDGAYSKMTAVSAMSVRRMMPDATIEVIVPSSGAGRHQELKLKHYVDAIVAVECHGSSAMERSRFLKTKLRVFVEGDFVFLDSDTLVLQRLDSVWNKSFDIGVVLDRNEADPIPRFPQWAIPLYQKLGWRHPIPYFNSGVLVVRDSDKSHALFDEWHKRWKMTVVEGVMYDQPSLNSACDSIEAEIEVLDDSFNALVDAVPRLWRNARVSHFFTKNGRPAATTILAQLVEETEAGRECDWNSVEECIRLGHPWRRPHEPWCLLRSGHIVGAVITKGQKILGMRRSK